MSAPRLAQPLRNPVYRRLFGAQVVALVGAGLTTVALGLLAFDLAGGDAGEVLGIALGLKMVSYVVVSPIVAEWASRVPRKRLLVGLDLVRALAVASIAFVDQVWQVYALVVVLSSASAGFTPAFQAIIPDIFENPDEYTEALSLSRIAYELEAIASPALAAGLLGVMTYSGLFAANAAAFLVSAALVLATAMPAVRTGGLGARRLRNIARGIGLYLSTPRLRGLLALNLAAAAASAMVIVNTVIYVKDELRLDDPEVAWALGAAGAGSIVVAIALPRIMELVRDRTAMIAGGALLAAALFSTAYVGTFGALLACWIAVGCGLALVQTPAGRLLQRSADSAERPALFAAQFSLSHLCWLATYPVAGFVGATFGLPAAALSLAGTATLATALASGLWPRRRNE